MIFRDGKYTIPRPYATVYLPLLTLNLPHILFRVKKKNSTPTPHGSRRNLRANFSQEQVRKTRILSIFLCEPRMALFVPLFIETLIRESRLKRSKSLPSNERVL